jgi:hypothetical protein
MLGHSMGAGQWVTGASMGVAYMGKRVRTIFGNLISNTESFFRVKG